ncbi:hypothetical protein [Streptomyces sp. NPDC056061]|uniref:hypothetical protein n=1 Tax=Streptomyces sp. NPDC056061 TaxID=3345700 RepID=UPI0035E1EA3E
MRLKRSLIGTISALTLVLAAGVTVGSAEAAAPSDRDVAAGQVLRTPAAPEGAAKASAQGILATSPSISPSAPSLHVAPGGTFTCHSGALCTAVWDPTTSNWEVFSLTVCARYSLSYWGGTGYYWDYQTGTPTSHFYNGSGTSIKSFTPFSGSREQNWDQVWAIRNC